MTAKDEIVQNIKLQFEAENDFYQDMGWIAIKHEPELLSLFEKNGNNLFMLYETTYNIFLYEYLIKYEQAEAVFWGIVAALKTQTNEMYELNNLKYDLYDRVLKKIRLYFYEFKSVCFEESDAQFLLYNEVMGLDDDNVYKRKLKHAIMHSCFEQYDDEKQICLINSALADYDLNYKVKEEEKAFAEQRYRELNYIPSFTNVSVGDAWYGRNRVADFIRALGLKPRPAGKNSRKAQEKSIRKSCNYIDDGNTLVLLEIYPVRLQDEIIQRKRKYEKDFQNVLFYFLKKNEGIFRTTKGKFC